jgi:tellurite resistance protein
MTQITEGKGRLAYFPISFFATVMGLSGLTIAWEKAQQIWGIDLGISPAMVFITSLVFMVIFALYVLKLFRHGDMVKTELKHPVKLSFFPAISISMILLSIAFLSINTAISLPLWIIGSSLHLLFTLYVINSWMHHEHYQIQHINPAWFIPAVGNILVPVAGVSLGFPEISWFFFSIGFMFWIVLMTIVFNRMMFHDALVPHLMPTLFILIAPPAVGLLAYVRLTGELGAFGNILYGAALFLTLLLFTQIQRFARLQFFLSWWAYSFPLAAITLASFVMYEKTASMLYFWIANGLLTILTLVLALLIFRTIIAILKGGICQPEH